MVHAIYEIEGYIVPCLGNNFNLFHLATVMLNNVLLVTA